MDEHKLIAALKQLASELGCTPTRDQFCSHIPNARYLFIRLFGSYGKLVEASGLVPAKNKVINNQIFERDLARHLESYKPRDVAHKPYPTIAVISDIHWPFASEKVLAKFREYVAINKPEWVVLNGDAWDMYSHSKFAKSHNVFTPRDEQNTARAANLKFWQGIIEVHPKAKCYQLLGNHDIRPMKRVLEVYPEAEDWIAEKLKEMFTFDGVTTMFDHREELIIGDIAIFHGYRTQLGAHRDYTLMNCINGHSHVGGTVFRRIRDTILWELNSGLAGMAESKGLTYTPQRITNWTTGFGVVDANGPRFIPVP